MGEQWLMNTFQMVANPWGMEGRVPEQWLTQFEHAFFEVLDLNDVIYVKAPHPLTGMHPLGKVKAEQPVTENLVRNAAYIFRDLGKQVAQKIVMDMKESEHKNPVILFNTITENYVGHRQDDFMMYRPGTPTRFSITPKYCFIDKSHHLCTPMRATRLELMGDENTIKI